MIRLAFCLAVAFAAVPAASSARVIEATPATVTAALQRATGGDTIRLAPGSYAVIDLRDRRWSPAVTVIADAATLRGVRLQRVSGVVWRGGHFDGGDIERGAFGIQNSDHVTLDGADLRRYVRTGVGVGSASDIRLTNNVLAAMGSDGIDIALSRRVVVDRNRCVDFRPTDGAHPDCIQLWSRPTAPPTADVTISNNEAIGDMQAFTMFNHVRDGVDDGGFDRIVVEHNHARVTSYHGVTMTSCRDCIVRHNRVETLPNPANPKIRAWIKVIDGSNVRNCDNVAESFPGDTGSAACRD